MYSCKREIKSDAYFIYVRPILEYAVCCWAPYTKCNIDKLELIQRQAARFVMKDYHPTSSITVMINKLKWSSLRHRKDNNRLQMMCKITHQLETWNYLTISLITLGHSYKLTIPSSRIDSYKYSYFPTTIKIWNKLQLMPLQSMILVIYLLDYLYLIVLYPCIAFILTCEVLQLLL